MRYSYELYRDLKLFELAHVRFNDQKNTHNSVYDTPNVRLIAQVKLGVPMILF